MGQLFAPTKQGVCEGRFLVDVLLIQRHMQSRNLATLPRNLGGYVVVQVRRPGINKVLRVKIARFFSVWKPFSPSAVLSARTLEVLHDALQFCDAVVDAKVTDASANVFSLIEPGVVAVYSKAQTRTVASPTVLELGNFTPCDRT